MSTRYAAMIHHLAQLTKSIAWGDATNIQELFQYTSDTDVPTDIAALAEQIGTIIVQKETREFQLEALIEKHIQTQKALEIARHDPLTGLPNRALFLELLEQECTKALREGAGLAVLFVDFDKFKQVNDTLGHDAGDELLIQGSQRIVARLGTESVVCRLGGDEFAAFLRTRNGYFSADFWDQLLASLCAPFSLKAGTVSLSASIGITYLPDEGTTATALLKNADVAMYKVKTSGRNGYLRYSPLRLPKLQPPRQTT